MTARQMQKEFEQSGAYIDAIAQFPNLRVISDDVNYYLNEAQNSFVNTRLNAIKNNIANSQRELDEIRTLFIKKTVLTKDVGTSTTEYFVYDLPSDYLYLMSDYSITAYCNVNDTYQNRLYPSENLQEIRNTTHSASKFNSPISELINTKLYVYLDKELTFTLNSVIIDYIKTFASIDVINGTTSELDVSTHKDIVQLAVSIFLESIGSRRFQSNVEKNILTEQVN